MMSASRRAGRVVLLIAAAFMAAAWTGAPVAPPARQSVTRPTAPQPPPRLGAIVGFVIDSLDGGPLVGAQISVEGINSQVLTDSTGRFHLDSVPPGRYRIGIFHPILDSLGMSIASPPLDVAADSTLSLAFATPSAPTIVRLSCGNEPADTTGQGGPSLIIGRVLDAETDAPVAGAHVSLRWAHIQSLVSEKIRRTQAKWDTATGPAGEFRFCHMPDRFVGMAHAARIAHDTSDVGRPFVMRGRLVRFLVLHVPAGDSSATHAANAAPVPGHASLNGRVVRSDGGRPFAGAVVTVAGTGDTARTGDNGQFTLRGLPAGSRTLEVRALGWEPEALPVELSDRNARNMVIRLATKTAVLDAVVVSATLNAGLHRVGFDSRKRLGIGHFLSPDDLANMSATEFVDLMATMPGVRRRIDPQGNAYVTPSRGSVGCVSYVIDGLPFVEAIPGQINDVMPVSEIGAVEVYQPSEAPPGAAFSPPAPQGGRALQRQTGQLRDPGAVDSLSLAGGTTCVKIVIWSKNRLGL
jgi:hypothetical protein